MPKVVLKTVQPQRKLKAVIGQNGMGFFVRSPESKDHSIYITPHGLGLTQNFSLEEVLSVSGRSAVYEGDTIEVTF